MIQKMRKYAFMIYHKEYDSFLSALRDAGVVHIQETKSVTDYEELQDMIAQRKRVESLIKILKETNAESKTEVTPAPAHTLNKKEGFALVESIEYLFDKKNELNAVKQSLSKDISYMKIWGDFSYINIKQLKKAGYNITFFTCPNSKYQETWRDDYNAMLINEYQSVKYFITITREGTVIDIDAERPNMPDRGLSKLQARYDQIVEDIGKLGKKIAGLAASEINTLVELDRSLLNEFNMENAIVQTDRQADDKLMFLEGWIVDNRVDMMVKELDKGGYFYQELEIKESENVPVQLKNNRFAKLYEPITNMYSLPNYWEFDSTPLVAPFFMLFFGLCLGDAGYGLLVLLAATIAKRKVPDSLKGYTTLFQFLGGAAMIVGTMSGSFFGIELVNVPFLQSVKKYFLSSDNLMTLSIVIGIIHVIVGKIIAAYKTKVQKGFKYSLAPFAWIFVVIAFICLFGLPSLDVHLPDTLAYVLYGIVGLGLLIAFLYNSPGKNIFLNVGLGLWDTFNMITGLLGDTLSYIRLFAIGLTGSVLGGVFNSLAFTMTETMSVVPRFIVMLLILLIGHGLAFALSMISSLVHPLRLIFVEYFKNSEFEGGGKAYTPFKYI